MASSLSRLVALMSVAALAIGPLPAQAQFGGLISSGKRGADKADTCGPGKKADKGRGVLGSLLGGAVDQLARNVGLPSFLPVPQFSDQILEIIACRLDPEEQKQAAEATLAITRTDDSAIQPEIGASAEWISATRANVSGTSTVTARGGDNGGGNGGGKDGGKGGGRDCITLTDVVIVEGVEARADKRMCRAPGSARYSIIA